MPFFFPQKKKRGVEVYWMCLPTRESLVRIRARGFLWSFGTENCGISLITETKLWIDCIDCYNITIEN